MEHGLELTNSAEKLLKDGLRALFIFSITDLFFQEKADDEKDLGAALQTVYSDLEGRFGIKVLGTLDDDLLQVGPTRNAPISYILAEVPNVEAVIAVTNLIRTRFKGAKLARYLTVEARVGHPLFFGTK